MSHVASADFTSFVSTPTNPISLQSPQNQWELFERLTHIANILGLHQIPYFIIIIIFLVRCLNLFQQCYTKYRLTNINSAKENLIISSYLFFSLIG